MNDIAASAEKLSGGIYMQSREEGRLKIICNYCTAFSPGAETVFYDGKDTEAPETFWLAEAVTHLVAEHPERFE